ncbi:N-acetylmuramoyl-L-alanine amidase [Pacificibacter marinus]|uniref:N-acetylmuramoyl-L-alanine amidase n=1 Tax=Pacificibacter marinus TaxID=658057 RepID=UPI001C078FF2|nr:N-acetylmuramoyl-L-alanine amidase [Pacificibacter marinus]MBU2867122.1 N-acetylmuramoyl-L-alanine amidase [Pacificibacter marinus]
MNIQNHLLTNAAFLPAYFTGGEITPEIVILHDTAGRLDKGNSATYLASENVARASVHFVIEVDGTITQSVATNRKANHAGKSSFQGREWCNGFSIGIELVNPGRMTKAGKYGVTWFGKKFDFSLFNLVEMTTDAHGDGVWMPYAQAQMDALISLLEVLFRDIKTLKDITTHWYVSPGRKIDTNPLFPLEDVRARILGPIDPADTVADEASQPNTNDMVEIDTRGGALNMRRWPSFENNILTAIPDGTVVPVLRTGAFAGRDWHCVFYDGTEGWIVASYAAPTIISTH